MSMYALLLPDGVRPKFTAGAPQTDRPDLLDCHGMTLWVRDKWTDNWRKFK